MDWIWGLIGSLGIAGLAYWKRSLSVSGVVGAVVLGTVMYALGSLPWFGTLIGFFISSSALSKLKHLAKAEAESGYAKSGRRDAGQVAANGGIALLLCIGNYMWPHAAWWLLFAGVMATVNADTWATEIGGLSKSAPRSILSGRQVTAGTSGGVTPLGLAASIAGGLFIGAVAWLLSWSGGDEPFGYGLPLAGIGAIAGLIGSLADSAIGASWQTMYRCTECGKVIEKKVHCGRGSTPVRGVKWMTNDAVNAVSSLIGGAAALLLGMAWGYL